MPCSQNYNDKSKRPQQVPRTLLRTARTKLAATFLEMPFTVIYNTFLKSLIVLHNRRLLLRITVLWFKIADCGLVIPVILFPQMTT